MTQDLPRNIQRVERMKIAYNKYVERITANPEHPKRKIYEIKMREYLLDIEATELRAQADEIEIANKEDGVSIEVPLKQFGLRAEVVEETG